MFPRELAEDVLSLDSSSKSPALSIGMTVDSEGGLLECSAHNSSVRLDRVTYIDLDANFNSSNGSLHDGLAELFKVSSPSNYLRERMRLFSGPDLYQKSSQLVDHLEACVRF